MNEKEKLLEGLRRIPCESKCEYDVGACSYRKYGECSMINKLDMCALNKMADNLITNGWTEQRWIPVTEQVPGKGQRVVFYNFSNDAVYAGKFNYIGKRGTVWFRVGKTSYPGSHWMPLPEPPKEGA